MMINWFFTSFRKSKVVEFIEGTDAIELDQFKGHVSILVGSLTVEVEAIIKPDELEDVASQMLAFARRTAEGLAGLKGRVVYDWNRGGYTKADCEMSSGGLLADLLGKESQKEGQ